MKILSESELAEFLNISKWTVRAWRLRGGLPFIQVGRRIFYQLASVEKWMDEIEGNNKSPLSNEDFVSVM